VVRVVVVVVIVVVVVVVVVVVGGCDEAKVGNKEVGNDTTTKRRSTLS